jgi:hypothetical protein
MGATGKRSVPHGDTILSVCLEITSIILLVLY